jgi:membrane protease YdiL (CAAX protease family)
VTGESRTPFRPSLTEAAIVAVGAALVDLSIRALVSKGSMEAWSAPALWLTALVRSAELLALYAWWRSRGRSLSDLGLRGPAAGRGIRFGLGISAAMGLLAFGVEVALRLGGGSGVLAHLGLPRVSAESFPALIGAAVVAGPLFEETVFRGFVYGAIRKHLSFVPSLALGTAVFALPHAASGNLPLVPAVGGILFCAGYEVTGSLWSPFLVHAAGNLALFALPQIL